MVREHGPVFQVSISWFSHAADFFNLSVSFHCAIAIKVMFINVNNLQCCVISQMYMPPSVHTLINNNYKVFPSAIVVSM